MDTCSKAARIFILTSALKSYLEHVALQIGIQVCSLDSNGRTSERERNADLTQIERKRQRSAPHLPYNYAYLLSSYRGISPRRAPTAGSVCLGPSAKLARAARTVRSAS